MYIFPLVASNHQISKETMATSTLFDVKEYIMKFLNNENEQTLLLQGDEGSGKTLFEKYLVQDLWRNYKDIETSIIPIFISLPQYYAKEAHQDIIKEYFEKQYVPLSNIQNCRFLFILDGLDKIKNLYDTCLSNIFEHLSLHKWNGNANANRPSKFIISC